MTTSLAESHGKAGGIGRDRADSVSCEPIGFIGNYPVASRLRGSTGIFIPLGCLLAGLLVSTALAEHLLHLTVAWGGFRRIHPYSAGSLPRMRSDVPRDVAAERQLIVIERVLVLLPRSHGFRVSADGTVSVYPAPQRARRLSLHAAKQEGSPKSKRASRSEQGSKRAATNARTRRSAARAAKHAERREQAEIRLSSTSVSRSARRSRIPQLSVDRTRVVCDVYGTDREPHREAREEGIDIYLTLERERLL